MAKLLFLETGDLIADSSDSLNLIEIKRGKNI